MDDVRRIEPYRHHNQHPKSSLITSPPPNSYSTDDMETSTPRDWRHHRRGRNEEQFDRVNYMSGEGFALQNNYHDQQYPERQHRRTHSADSRPQYHNSTSNRGFCDSLSPYNGSSYRERIGFSSSTSRRNSNRAHSDIGTSGGTDSFRFHQLPIYEAVIHDDGILYSSSERRQYKGNVVILPEQKQSSKDFPVWGNRFPNSSSTTVGPSSYNKDDRIEFVDRRHPRATRNDTASAMSAHHNHDHRLSLHEQERQYYDFAKENLITFGGCDAPTASTGLSQEELLQRKRREETREKRRDKRKNKKAKNRIINFPSSLLKASNLQQNHFSLQNKQQNHSSSSNYQKMAKFTSLSSNSRRENVYNRNGNSPNSNINADRGGIRGSMIRRQRNKSKKTADSGGNSNTNNYMKSIINNNKEMDVDETTSRKCLVIQDSSIKPGNTEIIPASFMQKDNFDRFMEDPNLLPGNDKNTMLYDPKRCNSNRDYLFVQRDLDHSTRKETTPSVRGGNTRPRYAEFTPRSDYSPRELIFPKHQGYIKDSSPISVMDTHSSSSGGVRWNENLTQQKIIVTPQSSKLCPDSDGVRLRNSAGKPKSILRSRLSSLYAPKVQTQDRALNYSSEYPLDECPEQQQQATAFLSGNSVAHVFVVGNDVNSVEAAGRNAHFPTMMGFVDENGRSVSPIGVERQGDVNGKFPESYVQFIEAVASVVIQTKVRQKLAKNLVREMQNKLNVDINYRCREIQMTPMVRKSYALARKVRQGNEVKKSKGRKDVAFDFYALAAIQIQAAFRGWWVRDCLGIDNYCATMIQKTYRGSCCRNNLRVDLSRVAKVQSICRRWLALDDAVTRIYCIVRIQAIVRGSLVRKRTRFDALENNVYHAAAITIQTNWRSFWCEMKFLRTYEDILVVQSIVRGWIARRYFLSYLKNSKFSQRHKIDTHFDTRFKHLKLPSKSHNDSSPTYSNHIEYMRKSFSPGSRLEISYSQPSVFKKASKDCHLQSKDHNEQTKIDKRIQTMKGFSSKTGLNSLKEIKLRTQMVKSHAHKIVSASRSGIERRRKHMEQETKAQKEVEHRRLDLQAAEIAEIEYRREKMVMKAAARTKEELRTEKMSKTNKSMNTLYESHQHDEDMKINDDSYTRDVDSKSGESSQQTSAKIRKGLNKFNPVASSKEESFSFANTSKVESIKVAQRKCKVVRTESDQRSIPRIPIVTSVEGKSLVAKRMQELMKSNRNDASTSKDITSVAKPLTDIYKFERNLDSKIELLRTDNAQNDIVNPYEIHATDERDSDPDLVASRSERDNQALLRTSRTSSTYQKDMQNIRSEVEQNRIDGMHRIFEQAGLFSRVK